MRAFRLLESELLITPEILARQLIETMNRLGETQPGAGNTDWTPEVKGFLRDIAKSLEKSTEGLSLEVIYTKITPGTKEFVLDAVWWARKDSEPKHEWMALAAEIEWASTRHGASEVEIKGTLMSCIGEDFAKLLVVKCPLKVLIFCTGKDQNGSHEGMQDIAFKEIDRNLDPYRHHIPGEHYIFIDTASNGHRRAWLRTVGEDGELSDRRSLDLRTTS